MEALTRREQVVRAGPRLAMGRTLVGSDRRGLGPDGGGGIGRTLR